MPPKTRAQKKKDEASQPIGQPQSQQEKTHVKPQSELGANKQPTVQSRGQRGKPKGDRPARGQNGPAPPQPLRPGRRTPSQRRYSNPTRPLRVGTQIVRDPSLFQRIRSGIRKKPLVRYLGKILPRFDTPFWEIISGVPTIVLRPLALGVEAETAYENQDDIEEILVDSESDDSLSSNRVRDQTHALSASPPLGHPDPPPPLGSPIRPESLAPPPSPKQPQPGDHYDIPLFVDSQAKAPRWNQFFREFRDDPDLDVRPLRFPNVGFASEVEIEKWGRRMARFVRSPYDDSADAAGWYGMKPLGKGGFGMAGLWEKRDLNGEVVDQAVIKQTGKDRYGRWDPRKPDEAECMQGLNMFTSAGDSTVRFRGYKRYPRREVHRIYMEYCSYGDLHKLTKEYAARRHFIPERFIWHVFYHLARACKAMEELPPEDTKTPENTETVHRDIKPDNVFLGNPSPSNDPHCIYPTPKLADFGIVVFTGAEDPQNPTQYRGEGTPGYMALEQESLPQHLPPSLEKTNLNRIYNLPGAHRRLTHYRRHESSRGKLPQILSHTNIFGMGATIFELMSLKQAKYYLYVYGDGREEDGETYLEGVTDDELVRAGLREGYSKELVQLMRECLRPNPGMRPGTEEVLGMIEQVRELWYGEMEEEDRIPWGEFENLEVGEWERDEGQMYSNVQGSRFSRSSLNVKEEK
ncbi:MAG: hypothetical protein Q9170_003788 [Blastenia crenularia]